MKPLLKNLCCLLVSVACLTSLPAAEAGKADAVKVEMVSLKAEDGGRSYGLLYMPKSGKAETVIISMHPRGSNIRHFTLEPAAQNGYAAFGLAGRWVNDEERLVHEDLLLDIAAAIRFLKVERGIKNVVLIGHSGGGPLMALYQSQAATAPPDRLRSTPAGDPPDLNKFELPPAEGFVAMAAHRGEGKIFTSRLDAAVIDERDPLATDPALDMYNPENGYRRPPQESRYSPEFMQRYRQAQMERVRRLDQLARSYIETQKRDQKVVSGPDFEKLPLREQNMLRHRALLEPRLQIYRSVADPRYVDLSLDPSDRVIGSTSGAAVEESNYGRGGGPTYMTARAFLSTRSGFSSNASLLETIRKVKIPTLLITGTADNGIFPSDTQAAFEASGASDKELVWIKGADHSFLPSGPKAESGRQREETLSAIFAWMSKRFSRLSHGSAALRPGPLSAWNDLFMRNIIAPE